MNILLYNIAKTVHVIIAWWGSLKATPQRERGCISSLDYNIIRLLQAIYFI